MFPLAKTILKGALARDDCRVRITSPILPCPASRGPTRPRGRHGRGLCDRFEADTCRWLKSTIAVLSPDGEPQLTYEDVNTSLIPPRPRLYGLVGAEVIEEVWNQRARSCRRRQQSGQRQRTATIPPRKWPAIPAARGLRLPAARRARPADVFRVQAKGFMMSHSNGSHAGGDGVAAATPRFFDVRVLRQDGPEQPSYWQRHRVQLEPDMNVTSVLQRIAAKAQTADGEAVAPVAYESNCLEEVCGSCTMLINGRTRQACSASSKSFWPNSPTKSSCGR